MGGRILVAVFLVLCGTWQVQAAVANCTAAGRFANTSDPTCQNFTLCVYNPLSGGYLAYYNRCPTTSVFNPNTQRCTTNYVCNDTSTNKPVSACVDEGFFENENSTDCTTFIACVAFGGTFIEIKYTCPTRSYFDPILEDCSFNYLCPTVCIAAGRFANTADKTCATFYNCVAAPGGGFVLAQYTCPSPSLFNPKTKLCSTRYKCT
ncbi:uncharacterized protein LOC134741548 [Cydia strobilella]|uniref:uncharacterized protein LOC134741548 n=1 Tax=Cydia strobilella TaxID=1100964 RepID=UPI003006FDC4